MGNIAAGCGRLDPRDIDDNDKIVYGDRIYIRAQVDEKIYFYGGYPFCVVRLNSPIYATPCLDQAGIAAPLLMANGALNNAGDVPAAGLNPENSSGAQARSFPANTNLQQLQISQGGVDIGALNQYQYQPASVMPTVACIPMRSNVLSYGPYFSSNFNTSYGGINVVKNTDLCPWVYGSVAGMHGAGLDIANSTSIGLIKAETGSFTVPGFPSESSLGAALGAGPSLSDLSFSYGSNGYTTTYTYQTFTPKLGKLNEHTQDRLKAIARNRTEQLRFIRNQTIGLNKIGRKISGVSTRGNLNISKADRGARGRNSLSRVLVGEIYDWHTLNDGSKSNRTVVGIGEMAKVTPESVHSYKNKAYTGLDFYFGPVSKSGESDLPQYGRYAIPSAAKSSGVSTYGFPLGAHPPVSDGEEDINELVLDQYNIEINRQYLDPLVVPQTIHHHGPNDRTTTGHPYDIIGRGDTIPSGGLLGSRYAMTNPNKYPSPTEDMRFHALRGPLVLHSWGYDTDGKPIPNESDNEQQARRGNYTSTSLKDKFLTNWISKPQTWPVAPVDLRYDRARGVWTAPPPHRIIAAELLDNLDPGGSVVATVLDTQRLYNQDGQPIAKPTIRIKDRIDTYLSKGTKVYCYYDPYFAEYIAFTSIDNFPIVITGQATATFAPGTKETTIRLITNAKLGDNNVNPSFIGYPSSPLAGSMADMTIKAYNVKKCGALAEDCVTLHRVTTQGFDTQSAIGGSDIPYVYIISHTGDNYNND